MVGILYLISYSLRLVSYILYILNIKYLIPGIIYIISYSLLPASSKPVTADSTALRTCRFHSARSTCNKSLHWVSRVDRLESVSGGMDRCVAENLFRPIMSYHHGRGWLYKDHNQGSLCFTRSSAQVPTTPKAAMNKDFFMVFWAPGLFSATAVGKVT